MRGGRARELGLDLLGQREDLRVAGRPADQRAQIFKIPVAKRSAFRFRVGHRAVEVEDEDRHRGRTS